jgi:outer membrane protein TolC
MKTKAFYIILLSIMGTFSLEAPAQALRGRWGIGLGGSAQGLNSGLQVNTMRWGYGADGVLSYRLSNRLGLALTGGYNQLPSTLDRSTVDLFFGDLKFDLELWRGFFRPYLSAGAGMLNFAVTSDSVKSARGAKGATDGVFLGGGGVRLILGRKAIFDLGASYKQTTAKDLDGDLQNGNNSFLTFRSGVTLLFGTPLFERAAETEASPIAALDSLDTKESLASSGPLTMASRAKSLDRSQPGHDSASANHFAFYGQPFSEAEISEVARRPLTLDDCIRIALRKNISLRLAEAEVMKTEASLSGSYGKFLPILTLTGNQENALQKRPFDPAAPNDPRKLTFNNAGLVGAVRQNLSTGAVLDFTGDVRRDFNSPDQYGVPPTRTQNFAYMISLTQPLLRGAWSTVARSSITLAKYDRQIQAKQFSETKLTTVFAVKKAYYNVLRERELIKVNQAAIQRDSALVKASETMMQAKVATRRDILSAQIRLADDRAGLIKSQTLYEHALDALKEVLGLPLKMPIALAETELSLSSAPLEEDELIRLAWNNHPSMHNTEIAINRAQQVLKVNKNALLPQLNLTVSHSGQLDTDTDRNKDLWTAGLQASLSLSYPFLNREAVANAENAQIAVSQQEDRMVNLQRQIALGVRNIIRNVRSIAEEVNALEATITAANEKVNFATAMFRLGRASNLDITDAQEALLKAQDQRVSKLVDYYTELALLESLIGQPTAVGR